MRLLLPAIILAVAIILAPVLWVVLPRVTGQGTGDLGGPAIDSGARIEIEGLSQQVMELTARVELLTQQLQELESRPPTVVARAPVPEPFSPAPDASGDGGDLLPMSQDGPNEIIDAYAQVVLIVNRREVNDGLTIAGPSWLAQTFGLPSQNLSDDCGRMTNPRLADKLVTADVGPIRVTMLQPAIDSLTRVFEKVRTTDPDLYARINTAGSLCVRLIRGSTNRASTHSYGLAVDLNIDGQLDTLGDGRTQLGLTILADFFKEEGWVWGASWSREDSMHFEVSRQKLEQWIEDGVL